MHARVQALTVWFQRHERRLSTVAFLFGFVFDNLTLTRIDLLRDNLILFAHLTIVAFSIIVINLFDGEVLRGRFWERGRYWLPILMQFSFGGLFSGFFVFYARSSSFAASWLFLLFLVGLLVGNEFFRNRYLRMNFQISMFYAAIFAYMIFFVPVVVGRMGGWVFLLSGLVSLLLISLLLYALRRFIPHRIEAARNLLAVSIGGIFLLMNLLYFFNVIPPIPLSLKKVDVYHFLTPAVGGGYEAKYEDEPWHAFLQRYKRVHLRGGSSLYVYSAIFAPTRLSISVVHHWQYFDEVKDEWVTSSKIGFPISGGRDGGYRGYTKKSNPKPGWWRVSVETERGQSLGRIKFKVEETENLPPLQTKTL